MNIKSKFIIVDHFAKRAGTHKDLRFKRPNSDMWDSYATKKDIPLETGKKIMIVKTHAHSEEDALFIGKIESGYGAGHYEKWDYGDCIILKYHPRHIVLEFKGKKIKGVYHILSTGVVTQNYKAQTYLFFKGKIN